MSAPARIRVRVHGRVQGVWFRESTRRRATELGLAGWVRNAADGTVEVVFEGTSAAVDEAVRWCADGPTGASVDRVEAQDEPPEGLIGFEIRT